MAPAGPSCRRHGLMCAWSLLPDVEEAITVAVAVAVEIAVAVALGVAVKVDVWVEVAVPVAVGGTVVLVAVAVGGTIVFVATGPSAYSALKVAMAALQPPLTLKVMEAFC